MQKAPFQRTVLFLCCCDLRGAVWRNTAGGYYPPLRLTGYNSVFVGRQSASALRYRLTDRRYDTALATKQSPGLFLPNANAFGASCLLHCVQFTHRTLQDYNLQKCRAGCPHPAACARFHQGLAFYLIPPAVRPRRIWTGTPRPPPPRPAIRHIIYKKEQTNNEIAPFSFLCYLLPKARLFSRADGRTNGENPAPPDQRAAASNPGCVAGAGHSWGSPRR